MITVLGSINFDMICRVSRLPTPGETAPGSDFLTAPGGKGANQALAVARAGAPVAMVGAIGGDGFAGEAVSLLKAGGVGLESVQTVEGPTGVALILVDEAGENVIAVAPGANGTLAPAGMAKLAFQAGDVLLLQLEIPVAAMDAAAAKARAAGASVVLNFAPFRSDALGLVEHATHLVVNESECALIADALGVKGSTAEAKARALAETCNVSVIVTLGGDGVTAVDGGATVKAPALPVDVVDTVGAGDTFCGYLAAALHEGLAEEEALTLAAAAGSLACTKPGAQPSIPRRADVAAALAQQRAGAI